MNGVLLHSITVKPHKIIKGNQGLRKKALSSIISQNRDEEFICFRNTKKSDMGGMSIITNYILSWKCLHNSEYLNSQHLGTFSGKKLMSKCKASMHCYPQNIADGHLSESEL